MICGNKTVPVRNNVPILRLLFLSGAVLLFSACGIENYIYLEPISTTNGMLPSDAATSSQESDWRLFFRPADSANDGNYYYRGTEILYRIYRSSAKCYTDYSAISYYNSNTTTQANIFSYLTNTMKFKRLYSTGGNSPPLIPADSSNTNRDVEIRFITYDNATVEDATVARGIFISTASGKSQIADPRRDPDSVTSGFSNAFYEFIETPDTAASDVDNTAKTAADDPDPENRWYLTAWAFAYGVDDNYSPVYSTATYLGTVPLVKGDD